MWVLGCPDAGGAVRPEGWWSGGAGRAQLTATFGDRRIASLGDRPRPTPDLSVPSIENQPCLAETVIDPPTPHPQGPRRSTEGGPQVVVDLADSRVAGARASPAAASSKGQGPQPVPQLLEAFEKYRGRSPSCPAGRTVTAILPTGPLWPMGACALAPRRRCRADAHSRRTELDVVICTYDNAANARRASPPSPGRRRRRGGGACWSSTTTAPTTPAEVVRATADGAVPGLRWVTERVQGLTPARLRGVDRDGRPVDGVRRRRLPRSTRLGGQPSPCPGPPGGGGFGGRVTPCHEARVPALAGLRVGVRRAGPRVTRPAPSTAWWARAWSSTAKPSTRPDGRRGPCSPTVSGATRLGR